MGSGSSTSAPPWLSTLTVKRSMRRCPGAAMHFSSSEHERAVKLKEATLRSATRSLSFTTKSGSGDDSERHAQSCTPHTAHSARETNRSEQQATTVSGTAVGKAIASLSHCRVLSLCSVDTCAILFGSTVFGAERLPSVARLAVCDALSVFAAARVCGALSALSAAAVVAAVARRAVGLTRQRAAHEQPVHAVRARWAHSAAGGVRAISTALLDSTVRRAGASHEADVKSEQRVGGVERLLGEHYMSQRRTRSGRVAKDRLSGCDKEVLAGWQVAGNARAVACRRLALVAADPVRACSRRSDTREDASLTEGETSEAASGVSARQGAIDACERMARSEWRVRRLS